jgi:hypothetical protein
VQALHHRQQRDQGAHDAPGLGAGQLGRVRITLLRHDRAAGGEGVGQADEAERGAAPHDDLLGQAGEVDGADGGGGKELQREIAIGDGIERVGAGAVEAEGGGGGVPVNRERGAGQRRGAQRALVEPAPGIGEAAAVAGEHLDIGEQMVAEGDRLRRLQVGEAGHRVGSVLCGAASQFAHQAGDLAVEAVDGVPHP